MEEMNTSELLVEKTIEANTLKVTLKILKILNECENLEEAKQKVNALLN